MRSLKSTSKILAVSFGLAIGCQVAPTGGPENAGGSQAGGAGSGGSGGSGGASSSGGATGNGGASSSGGSAGSGGAAGSGGSAGSGGVPSSGGTSGTGGATGTGGSVARGTGGAVGSGGTTGTGGGSARGGATGTGGRVGTGGVQGTGGRVGTGGAVGTGGTTVAGGATGAGGSSSTGAHFSFFVTSIESMRSLSGSQDGFGGDLRYGESTGLAGADKICKTIAEKAVPGSGAKGWVAFLSATTGGSGGGAVNAIDRVGNGPWYDRNGRVVAMTKADLAKTRPANCDTLICNDLPNETGTPNHINSSTDNHDVLTGSTSAGMLSGTSAGATCNDWTSAVGATGRPMLGHSWPANSGQGWIQAHAAGGCAPGVNLVQSGGANSNTVGSAGGYGAIYCFALQP